VIFNSEGIKKANKLAILNAFFNQIYNTKSMLIRNLLPLLFFISIAFSAKQLSAQDALFTFRFDNKSLKNVLNHIEKNSQYKFFYNSAIIDTHQKKSISIDNQPIDVVMNLISEKYSIGFLIQSKQIILFNKTPENTISNPTTICGTVTTENNEALPGVNIVQKGTLNGTITDADGKFCLDMNSKSNSIIFSFIGYYNKEISIKNNSDLQIKLFATSNYLKEVIVTAMGFKRSKQMLGFSAVEIKGDEFSTYSAENIADLLTGKIAGVNISKISSGENGSNRIVFRGESSLRDANEPLIVIDGIPVDNSNLYEPTKWGGFDTGNGISDILSFDIESVSILKGANAAALYGTRAANGVIVFTTKRGQPKTGLNIQFRNSFAVSFPNVYLDFQNVYGRGMAGKLPVDFEGITFELPTSTESWGPKMEGQMVRIWNGEIRPYLPEKENYTQFWETALRYSTNISVAAGNNTSYIRTSVSYSFGTDIIPNSHDNKYTISMGSGKEISKRLRVDTKLSFISADVFNRPNMAYHPDNPMYSFIFMPRNIRLSDLENYKTADDYPVVWDLTSKTRMQNPYWSVYLNTNNDLKKRFLGYISTEYKITESLKASLNIGTDQYTFRREERTATHTIFERTTPNGDKYLLVNHDNMDFNADFILSANTHLGTHIMLSGVLGANAFHTRYEQIGYQANGLNIPNFFAINNALNVSPVYDFKRKKIHSIYGALQAEYRNFWFIDATFRNDWSSTLPASNRSFFYPSINTSLIVSEWLKMEHSPLNFLKIRASLARVGNDTDPYQLTSGYRIYQGHLGQAYGMIYPNTAPISDLKTEISLSTEAGIEAKFLKNRITLDATLYKSETKNQVLNVPVSRTSGYSSKLINAGKISNKGIELMAGFLLVENLNFKWLTTLNFAKNISEVVELAENIHHWGLGDDKGISVSATVGRPYGDLRGKAYLRNSNGDIIVDAQTGLPKISVSDTILGNFHPDWMGSISQMFRFKNITFSVMFDIRKGGEIYSLTNVYSHQNGNAKATLNGREGWYESENQRIEADLPPYKWFPTGGVIVDGVVNKGTENEPVWVKNSLYVDPAKYWFWLAGGGNNSIAEAFIYDASFIKIREVLFSYQLSDELVKRTPFQSLNVSASVRDLMYLKKNTPNISPESSYSTGNIQGVENCAFPSTRKFVFTLNLGF